MSVADKLTKEFEDREDELLDDLVHAAASKIGSAVNNGGVSEQIRFLLEQGYNEDDIREAFNE